MTLAAVWPRLSDRDRDVLTALAVHDDVRDAAAALGMVHSSFRTYLSTARRAVLALWHDWETPHRPKGYASRRNHHVEREPCGTYAAWRRHKKNRETACEPCAEAVREYERTRPRRPSKLRRCDLQASQAVGVA